MQAKTRSALVLAFSMLCSPGSSGAATQVVNIDFNGIRPGDTADAGTYSGVGAGGTGTVFNGIIADSTGGSDNLTVSGSGLLDETGAATTVGFVISPVGGDHEPGQPWTPASLYSDYVFNNSAGNVVGAAGSPFTISGLGLASTADVYFYLNAFNAGTIELGGVAGNGVSNEYNGIRATAFLGVPVSGGSITGILGTNGAVSVLGGLTVVTTTVPEPGASAMLATGALGLLLRRKRAGKGESL